MYMARNSKICLFLFLELNHDTSIPLLGADHARSKWPIFLQFSKLHERGALCQSITPFNKTLGDRKWDEIRDGAV